MLTRVFPGMSKARRSELHRAFVAAERVGFEPTDHFKGGPRISSAVRSTRLRHLSRRRKDYRGTYPGPTGQASEPVRFPGRQRSPSGPRSPAQGGVHEYGGVQGPRAQNTQRSLAASAHFCMLSFTLSLFQPRRPSSPLGSNVPARALIWKVQCESSIVAGLMFTAAKLQLPSREAM